MNKEVHSQLVMALLEAPGMNDSIIRTSLLGNIPNNHSLTRSQDPQADVSLIVNQLATMHFSNGEWGLLIFINAVLLRVLGTTLSDRLLEICRLLEAEQGAKDKEHFSTPLPHSEEVHEEIEKNESAFDDAHNVIVQQAQEYRSEVMEAQQLLLEAREPLKVVYKLFKEGRGIRQDQCDKAVFHINNLNAYVLKIHELYDKYSRELVTIHKLNYRVKVLLNDIDDQVDELITNLHIFRDSCPVYQSDIERKQIENDRNKISERLVSLMETLEEINNLLNKFLHEAVRDMNKAC